MVSIGIVSLLVIGGFLEIMNLMSEHASAYTTHDPIYIDGNINFTPENGITGGTGTQNDPYIIEGWDISASTAHGIEIRNTDAYFVIRNCYVHDGKANYYNGIYFYNVQNGRVENISSKFNYHGIYLDDSSDNNIFNNTANSNNYYGLHRKYVDPEPAHGSWGEEETETVILTIDNPYQSHDASGISLTPYCHVDVTTSNGSATTLKWYENTTGVWVLQQTNASIGNGTYYWTYDNATSYNTKYWWKVNATMDVNSSIYDEDIYSFTTQLEPADYQEQSPPPQSEWEGAYTDNKLVSNYAWCNISKVENSSTHVKTRMFDHNVESWYATTPFDISSSNPAEIYLDFHGTKNCSYLRFYYYDDNGLDFCPCEYDIVADGSVIHSGNYTASVNGQWVKIDFPDVECSNLIWKINKTRGSNPTQVSITELEVFSAEVPTNIIQESISYFEEIPDWWNGLNWSVALHVDDITSASAVPSAWRELQPLTFEMMGSNPTFVQSYVDDYHVEYGTHTTWNQDGGRWKGYQWWYNLAAKGIGIVEDGTTNTSLWSDLCINLAIPWSQINYKGCEGMYDAGIRIAGNAGNSEATSPTWTIPNNLGNMSVNNVSYPRNIQDWMMITRQGGKPQSRQGWTTAGLIEARENNSFADCMLHVGETMDSAYVSFIENDISAWHATWGEIVSYWWYKEWSNITYNTTASTSVKKVFDVKVHNTDDRIWEVPMTFKFNIPGWNGSAVVRWTDNGTLYKDSWDNISVFSTGSGQHINQTMREGYRWDGTTLYLSTRLSNKSIELGLGEEEEDTTPPVISSVSVSDITAHSAVMTWTTDESSDSTVNYSENSDLSSNSTKYNSTMTTSHSVTLTELSSRTLYYYEVSSADKYGNTATDTNNSHYYRFTTLEDTTPPTIISVTPEDLAINVPITTNVIVEFSEPMNKTATEGAFTLETGGTPVSGAFSWNANNDTMTFDPTLDLVGVTMYWVNITTEATDLIGNPLTAPWSSSFTTEDVTLPEITDVTVIPGLQEVYDFVNVSANVSDNVGVDTVWMDIAYPNGGIVGNFTMSYDPVNDRYYKNQSYDIVGTYQFIIWANDTSDNWNSSTGQFTMQDTPPATPTSLTVTDVPNDEGGALNITWDANTEPDLNHYILYSNKTGSWTVVTEIPAGTEYYVDTGLTDGIRYYYNISASDITSNESPQSATASGIPADNLPPTTPTGLTAQDHPNDEGGAIDLDWNDNTEADLDHYNIYRSTTRGGPYTKIGESTISDYTDSITTDGVTYYYVVTASDEVPNESGYSNEASASSLDNLPPATPTGLAVTSLRNGGLNITWNLNTDDTQIYSIYSDKTGTWMLIVNVTHPQNWYVDTGLTSGTTYYYNISAWDEVPLESLESRVVHGVSSPMSTISGTVKDKNGNPIEGANIVIYVAGTTENPVTLTTTNSNGEYSVDIPPGTYDVKIEKSGYETQWKKDVEVTADQTTTADLTLPFTTDILRDYWWLILLVVIIIVIIIIVTLIAKKKKPVEEEGKEKGVEEVGGEGISEEKLEEK